MDKMLVVLSGGQDSTTALFWAKEQGVEIHAITINYGQRHAIEIEAAKKIAKLAGVESHEIIDLGAVLKGASPLLPDGIPEVGKYQSEKELPGGIEPTFVPMRNALFLVLAFNRAAVLQIKQIVMGVCEVDYGGYPDCRSPFINMTQDALNYGLTGSYMDGITVHTPLMHRSKAAIVQMATKLPGCMEALAFSHTCYDGQYPPNPFNHASILRAKGFHDAGVDDPLIIRAKMDAVLPADYPNDGYLPRTVYQTLETTVDVSKLENVTYGGFRPDVKRERQDVTIKAPVLPTSGDAIPTEEDAIPTEEEAAEKPKKKKR